MLVIPLDDLATYSRSPVAGSFIAPLSNTTSSLSVTAFTVNTICDPTFITCVASHALRQHPSSLDDTNSSRIFSAAIATLNLSSTNAPIKSCAILFTVPTKRDSFTGVNTSHRARTRTSTCPLACSTLPNPPRPSSSSASASSLSDVDVSSSPSSSPSSSRSRRRAPHSASSSYAMSTPPSASTCRIFIASSTARAPASGSASADGWSATVNTHGFVATALDARASSARGRAIV